MPAIIATMKVATGPIAYIGHNWAAIFYSSFLVLQIYRLYTTDEH